MKSKKIVRGLIGSVLALACALPVLAHAGAIEQFKVFVAQTKSSKGEFVQQQVKKVNGVDKVTKTASGTFLFARPGKFIWTYTKPYEQVLQADGEQFFMYDKDLNQVSIKALNGALASSPAAILFGSNDLEQNFTLKETGLKGELEWLGAIPKAKDSQFEVINIGLKDGMPVAMELKDTFGQTSLITLSKIERNPSLKADQFKFVVPKGADIFRQ